MNYSILNFNQMCINHKPDSNEYSGLKTLEYFQPDIVRLNLPFIQTENKMLILNMPYLKVEGTHIDAVRLLSVWDSDGYVYLKIMNLANNRIDTLTWLLDYSGTYWLWSLTSLGFILNEFLPTNCN